jgi:hypothetical protein
MRIKMLVNVTGGSGAYEQGQVVDVPKAEALALVRRGWAVLAGPVSVETAGGGPELEAAALSGPEEMALEPAPRRKGRF